MPVLVGTAPVALEEFPLDLPTRMYLGDSGIVLGNAVLDGYDCRWRWTSRNAWGNKPAPREQVGDRSFDDGQWDATRYYGPRTLSIPGHCLAPTHAALHAAEQRLRDAVGVGAFQVRVTEPGYDSWALVRQQGEITWNEINPKAASFSIGLYAPDPRIWSSLERTIGPLPFPSITGGLSWPATWPATWATTSVSGTTVLLNPSAFPVGMQLRVRGPATSAAITFPETGEALYLENPAGTLLTAGQWLDIDTETRQVLLNGNASRRSWAYGDWPMLPPRAQTTFSIFGIGTSTTSGVSGTYRAARI